MDDFIIKVLNYKTCMLCERYLLRVMREIIMSYITLISMLIYRSMNKSTRE